MVFAAILIMMGEIWLVSSNWIYFLLFAIDIAIFLNGLRIVVQALRRLRQKVAIFEHGFTLWRNGALSLADRQMLWAAVECAQDLEEANVEGEMEDEFDEENVSLKARRS